MRCDVMKISKSNPSVKTCGLLMMSTFTCDMSPAYDYSSVPKKQPKPQDATHTTVSVYLAAGFATIFFESLCHFGSFYNQPTT